MANVNYSFRDLRKRFCVSAPKKAPVTAIAIAKATCAHYNAVESDADDGNNLSHLEWSDSVEAACLKKSRRADVLSWGSVASRTLPPVIRRRNGGISMGLSVAGDSATLESAMLGLLSFSS